MEWIIGIVLGCFLWGWKNGKSNQEIAGRIWKVSSILTFAFLAGVAIMLIIMFASI